MYEVLSKPLNVEKEIKLYSGAAVNVIVPPEIDGVPVTRIGDYAFNEGNLNIYQAVLPDTVKEIGYGCFRGSYVESVILPEGLVKIDGDAFTYVSMSEFTLPASLRFSRKIRATSTALFVNGSRAVHIWRS